MPSKRHMKVVFFFSTHLAIFLGFEKAKQIYKDLKIEKEWIPSRIFLQEGKKTRPTKVTFPTFYLFLTKDSSSCIPRSSARFQSRAKVAQRYRQTLFLQ